MRSKQLHTRPSLLSDMLTCKTHAMDMSTYPCTHTHARAQSWSNAGICIIAPRVCCHAWVCTFACMQAAVEWLLDGGEDLSAREAAWREARDREAELERERSAEEKRVRQQVLAR